MNKLIVAAIRCLLILLVPAIAYAITAQWTTNSGKAKNGIGTHPTQHSAAHNKRAPGRNAHGARAAQGKHRTGGSTHTQRSQQHVVSAGRHSRAVRGGAHRRSDVTPTPTPTPTPTVSPESDITATATPAPIGDSTATP